MMVSLPQKTKKNCKNVSILTFKPDHALEFISNNVCVGQMFKKNMFFFMKEIEDLLPQSKGTKSGDILKFLIRHLRNSYLASLQTLGTP